MNETPRSNGECAGRVALVTGASKGGTGTAIAVRLAAEGAAVALVARDEAGLATTAERIRDAGGTAFVVPVDLADPDGGRSDLVPRVAAELGPVDILVNNAAANGYRPFTEWTPRQMEICQQVNVWAPWQLMADVAPSMIARQSGWIVNLTSFAAEHPPGPPFPATMVALAGSGYGSTKAALNRLTTSVAAELHSHGIAVNAISPQSAIATPHLLERGDLDPEVFEPLDTISEAVLALSVCDASMISGRIARSLQLLVELDRPVRTLDGSALVAGWQPTDLVGVIAAQAERLESNGWPDPFGL